MSDEPGSGSVRVLVVDDQQLIRDGIASLLSIQPGITIIGTAGDGMEAIAQAAALGPDVILMDVRMPEMDGIEAVAALREQAPACRILMLTTFNDEEYVVRSLRAGASGYLLKDLPATELADAVRLAHAGVATFDSSVAIRFAQSLGVAGTTTQQPPSDGAHQLTPREREVLRLVADGRTNREIARQMYLSEGTVKNHISRILSRLGLRDRTHAAIYARDNHLL